MGLAALVSAGLLAAGLSAVSPRWELTLRTEGRYRQVEPAAGATVGLGEAELQPAGRLDLVAPDWEFLADYRPRLVLSDRSWDRAVIHEAGLELRRPIGTFLLRPSLTGRYGTYNTLQLLQAGQSSGAGESQALPFAQTVLAEALQAQVTLAGAPAHRFRLEAGLAAYLDGGASPASRALMPLQRGLRARTLLEWQATRLGTLTSSLTGTAATFSSGPSAAFLVWEEGWRQRVTREVDLWLAAGASATRQRRDGATSVTTLPSGQAGVSYRFGIEDHAVLARLGATLAPAVDRITGEASQRLGGNGSYLVELGKTWRVSADAAGGVLVRGPQRRDFAWGGALTVGRRLGELVILDAGVRAYEQRQPRAELRGAEWSIFVGLSAEGRGKLPALAVP
jgi:hypothetical protein